MREEMKNDRAMDLGVDNELQDPPLPVDDSSDEMLDDDPGEFGVEYPEDAEDSDDETPDVKSARMGDTNRPICPVHIAYMRATTSAGRTTTYACQVPGCKETAKKVRPRTTYPAEPIVCPRRSCTPKRKNGKRPYLESDPKRSTGQSIKLVCPVCGFATDFARPEIALASRQQNEGEDLSTR